MIEQGKVYAECGGYSMTYYTFWKCVRVTEKSAWLIELGKRWASHDGYGQSGMTVCTMEPKHDNPKEKMVRRTAYIGSEYHEGEQLYENYMD